MTKRKPQPLASRVTAAALAVDRAAIASVIGRKVAKRQRRAIPEPVASPEPVPSPLATALRTGAKPRRTWSSRRELNLKRVTSTLGSAWGSGLRYGTKRWNKLEFVLERISANASADPPRTTRAASLLGAIYDKDTGDKLDAHDINGMAERGHIALED